MKYILASASERRQELLKRIITDFEIKVSNLDEKKVVFNGNLNSYVEELAEKKGEAILDSVKEDSIIISADTIVSYGNNILGKPKDEDEAFKMLKSLSGNIHEVYSGISVYNTKTQKRLTTSIVTKVKFSMLTDTEIKEYIKSKEPLDKAGAYGIQGLGGVFVEEIQGCYYNVVGLSLNKTAKLLKEIIK
ncbi:Maf-like protein [uncultured Clostridium sp.]|uniref:Maf-like protein n=1 Tax=uncultured Clostridium sp. TaxID=59620 RepID=UPI002631FAB6|nr:Maf-like protein [uncultured Clostridium sp.]